MAFKRREKPTDRGYSALSACASSSGATGPSEVRRCVMMRSRDGTQGSKSGGNSGPPRSLNAGSGGVLDRLIKCDFQLFKKVVILTPSSTKKNADAKRRYLKR